MNIAQLITNKVLNPMKLLNTERSTVPKESLVSDFTTKKKGPEWPFKFAI